MFFLKKYFFYLFCSFDNLKKIFCQKLIIDFFYKWGVILLEDNLLLDNYYYQMMVQMGVCKNVSIMFKVSFIVLGENGDSGVRWLYDGYRKVFCIFDK